ncbi:MAG: SEL1-like repeat protein [Alistipes sp.]|nr:SEL1-like repeat protein [Alistipes sp.]
MKYDVFISYRREGGYDTAKHIYDLLVRDGYNVSFDIDTLRNGDFDTQLLTRIEQCKDFILIVDKNCFDRTLDGSTEPNQDWLRCELAYALKLKKNIIPVFLAGVSGFPDNLPADVAGVTKKNGPEYNKFHFDNFYKQLCSRFLKSWSLKKKLITILLPIALVVGIALLLLTPNLQEEVRYIDPMTPHTTDVDELKEYATKIIEDAAGSLGFTDEVVAKNYWASESNAESELNLGFCYLLGYGCSPDISKAQKHIANAAKKDNAVAQYSMGVFYDYGVGVKMNAKQAMEWCLKAAEQGLVEAVCNYGIMCSCMNNNYEAHKWLNDAAEQEYAKAQYALGWFYGMQNNFTEGVYWMEEAADQEYVLAELSLANIYTNGHKQFQDFETAMRLYEKLSEQGNAIAHYGLSTCYAKGLGVDDDIELAVDYLKKSAEQGFATALIDLGQLYWSGMVEGIPQDYNKAMELFLEAAETGHPMAQIAIGRMYEFGWSVEKSMRKAKQWYRKAERQGVSLQQLQQMQQMQQMQQQQ